MTIAKTSAAIGITVAANTAQAGQNIGALNKQVGDLAKSAKATSTMGFVGNAALTGLEKATVGLGRASVAASKWGLGLGAVGAAAAAIGLTKLATDLGSTGADAMRMADRLGVPIERLSALQIAAHQAGSSAETMTDALVTLQDTVHNAAFGRDNDAAAAFRAIGIDVGNARDGARDFVAMLPKIADEVQRLAKVDPHAALHLLDALHLPRDLFPLLRRGHEGLQEYLAQAQQFGPMTQQQGEEALKLDLVMRQLGDRFRDFERIGGAAVAPGLTKFLDMLQHYLQDHRGDVEEFFTEIEHGIEWLTTPKNLAWLREELDKFADDVKELLKFLLQLEHNPLIRRLLGLPPEGPSAGDVSTAPIDHGIPTEDDGGRLDRALRGSMRDDEDRLRRGSGPTTDPQSLEFQPNPPGRGFWGTIGDWLFPSAHASEVPGAHGAMAPGQTSDTGVTGSLAQRQAGFVRWLQQNLGLTPERAAGLAGAATQESGVGDPRLMQELHPLEPGSRGGLGLFQWTGTRRVKYEEWAQAHGLDPHTMQASLGFFREEIMKPENARYLRAVQQAPNDPVSAAHAFFPFLSGGDDRAVYGGRDRYANDALAAYSRLGNQTPVTNDPGAHRFATDATTPAAPPDAPSYTSPLGDGAGSDRLGKLQIELRHVNPPPGAQLTVTSADPSQIDVNGPLVMGAMPGSGAQRNVIGNGN